MACYHPLKAFKTNRTYLKSGKPIMKITSFNTDFVSDKDGNRFTEFVEIPCGRCIGCRLDKSRQWANRCMFESIYHRDNVFLTLTYDDVHKPISISKLTGEVTPFGNLCPEHLTKFIKDLRRYYEYHYNITGIRFYACGEYGSKSLRPHYHLIVFGLPIYDKQFLFKNSNGDSIYTSKTIESLWPYGMSAVASVSWDSCAYVARYVMKKQTGEQAVKERYDALGQMPEFVRMSRRPGIGYMYYADNCDKFYITDSVIVPDSGGSKVVKPPKYFDRLFDLDSPEAMAAIKERRRFAADCARDSELADTSLDYMTYLKNKEDAHIERSKKLLRKL